MTRPARVLVTAASRYGSTTEIAETIAHSLTEEGLEVETAAPDAAGELESYDAVVVGSAVYYGRWLKLATELVRSNRDTLASKSVWLFSSGPTGAPGHELPKEHPVDIGDLVEVAGAREHHVFSGRLDTKQLRFRDRTVACALHAAAGDARDWDEVRAFAHRIADDVKGSDGS